MLRPKLIAYAQLMRLPNVFTAVADPLAGWLIVGGGEPAWHLGLLIGASACLYTSGIVLNDFFDYETDQRERPNRPLPRGDISRRTAGMLGGALLVAGLVLAWFAGRAAFSIALYLGAMILIYDAWAKRFLALGPLALGACRFANFVLGMRGIPSSLWVMPAVLAVYVGGLSFVARNEATRPAVRLLVKRLLLGIIVLDALFVALTGDWMGAVLVLSLLVPAVALSKLIPMT